MPSVAEHLGVGVSLLRSVGIAEASRDARLLMAQSLEIDPMRLMLVLHEEMLFGHAAQFERMIAARACFQPVSQIIGKRDFWGRQFVVTPAVLDPRPETETLVELALAGASPKNILDLGTGSAVLLVTLLAQLRDTWGVGVDISDSALMVAQDNATKLGVGDRAYFVRSDWCAAMAGKFDLIVSNPPYIPAAAVSQLAPDVRNWEPHLALSPGPTGLEAYGKIAESLENLLSPNGRALFEIGADQGAAVRDVFSEAGFVAISIHPDLGGRDRVIAIARTNER